MDKIIIDPVVEQMVLENLKRRIIDFNDDFNENTIYKLRYRLEKIVRQDDMMNIPMKSRKPITIRIGSYGGYVHELSGALSLIERLKKRGYTINTECDTKAMSCGFVLLCSGVNRRVSPYASILYHSVSAGAMGKVAQMIDDVEESKRLNEMIKNYIVSKTNITKEELDSHKYDDWNISPEDCLKYGIATEIF